MSKGQQVTIGDEPLDAIGQMISALSSAYEEETGRKPTATELERSIEIVLAARPGVFSEVDENRELSSVKLQFRRKPKRQPIARGDYFSVPLPSGGYGFGCVIGIYLSSVLLVDFLEAFSTDFLSVGELQGRPVLFRALCGYLGLANWHWRVLGNIQLPEMTAGKTEKQQLDELCRQFPGCLAPMGDAPVKLEDSLRKRGVLRSSG